MKPLRPLALLASLVMSATAIGAEGAKLFYAPAERARVTAERAAMLASEAGSGGDVTFINSVAPETATALKAGAPRLEGVSLPSGGRAHAWIGGRRYQEGEMFQGQRVRVMRGGVQLVGAEGASRLIRVGEPVRGAARR